MRWRSAALYFGPGAACSSSVTSSTLSTAGSRRGWRTTVSRRARSGRSSVTVKKKRRAETALLMLGGCMPLCRLMQLEAAQILRRRGVGRAADEGGKRPHIADVVVARLLGEAAHGHVLDHARPQRADGRWERLEVIGGSSLELKVAGPSMLGIGCPDRHALRFTASPTTHRPRRIPPARAGSFFGATLAVRRVVAEDGRSGTLCRPSAYTLASRPCRDARPNPQFRRQLLLRRSRLRAPALAAPAQPATQPTGAPRLRLRRGPPRFGPNLPVDRRAKLEDRHSSAAQAEFNDNFAIYSATAGPRSTTL